MTTLFDDDDYQNRFYQDSSLDVGKIVRELDDGLPYEVFDSYEEETVESDELWED